MTDAQPTTAQRIETIVREHVAVDGPLTAETSFADLGLDSLDVIEIILDIEETFAIELDMDEGEHLTTIGALVDLVQAKVAAR